MKKKLLSILLAAVLCLSLLPTAALAVDGVAYLDGSGNTQTCTTYNRLESGGGITLGGGWYVVSGDVTINGRLKFDADSNHLILTDGSTLTITGGLLLDYGTTNLTIYAQSTGENAGKLITSGGLYNTIIIP